MLDQQVRIGAEATLDARVANVVRRVLADETARRPEGWREAARDLGAVLPRPGVGRTPQLWSALATLGAADLQLARAVEPHLDALAILEEAFRIIDTATEDIDLGPLVEPYGCQADFDATLPLMEKYGLTFG